MDMVTAEWVEQAANDVQTLLRKDRVIETDRLDLLTACGRWAVGVEPEGGAVDKDTLRAARMALGRPIDAADGLPDFRGLAEALLDSSASWYLSQCSPEEARCYVEERMESGFALAALEILWPHEAEELHRYVRKRRGLGPYDRALETLQPWQNYSDALSLPAAVAQFSGLRPLLFGPIVDAVEQWSPLSLALRERRASVAAWHDAACRILEPRISDGDREAAVDAACARMLCIAAFDPDLARTAVQGRWKALLMRPAADTCLIPMSFAGLAVTDVVQGGRIVRESLPDLRPLTLGTRALSIAAYAQTVVVVAAEVLLRQVLVRMTGLVATPWSPGWRSTSLEGTPEETSEVLRESDVEVTIGVDRELMVVATVEKARQPVHGVTVALEHIAGDGHRTERARGETNVCGHVILGPRASFPMPQEGERYEVSIRRPQREGVQRR